MLHVALHKDRLDIEHSHHFLRYERKAITASWQSKKLVEHFNEGALYCERQINQ